MALFGISEERARRIAEGEATEKYYKVSDIINKEKTRICQLVALFLSIIPKKDLQKKLNKMTNLKYSEFFPSDWFDDKYNATVEELLEHIDP